MRVVADTGPLNYLVQLGHVGLLQALFGAVILPDAVCAELRHPGAPSLVRQWAAAPPGWVDIRQGIATLPLPRKLGAGERHCLALALHLRADLILMDDRLGVGTARRHGLAVLGTIGVLARGARRGLIDLEAAFDDLRRTNFRIDAALLDEVLTRHRQASRDE